MYSALDYGSIFNHFFNAVILLIIVIYGIPTWGWEKGKEEGGGGGGSTPVQTYFDLLAQRACI